MIVLFPTPSASFVSSAVSSSLRKQLLRSFLGLRFFNRRGHGDPHRCFRLFISQIILCLHETQCSLWFNVDLGNVHLHNAPILMNLNVKMFEYKMIHAIFGQMGVPVVGQKNGKV